MYNRRNDYMTLAIAVMVAVGLMGSCHIGMAIYTIFQKKNYDTLSTGFNIVMFLLYMYILFKYADYVILPYIQGVFQ